MPAKLQDINGHRFGKVIAQWPVARIGKQYKVMWLCLCDCGRMPLVRSDRLKNGRTRSCGCVRSEVNAHPKHWMTGTTEFRTWVGMNQRCHNPNNNAWANYGGRGISVCERWRESFENFYADMGPKPPGLSIDRINNNGNYEPGNCRWATAKEQSANKRPPRKRKLCQ